VVVSGGCRHAVSKTEKSGRREHRVHRPTGGPRTQHKRVEEQRSTPNELIGRRIRGKGEGDRYYTIAARALTHRTRLREKTIHARFIRTSLRPGERCSPPISPVQPRPKLPFPVLLTGGANSESTTQTGSSEMLTCF